MGLGHRRWIRPEWLLPLDRPPLAWPLVDRASGAIANGSEQSSRADVEDLPGTVILPALVNCHTHLDLSLVKSPLGQPGQSFADWVRLVIGLRQVQTAGTAEPIEAALRAGLEESQAAGVGLLGNICGAPWVRTPPGPLTVVDFFEQLGTASSAEQVRTEALRDRLMDSPTASPLGRTGISPHAPYSMDRRLFFRTMAMAIQRRVPVAMHIAESQEELQLLERHRGPLWDTLDGLGLLQESPEFVSIRECLAALAGCERSLVVHGNYLTDSDLELMARHRARMSLVYCPRTHAFFNHAPWPLRASRDRGIRVVLGTDSRATSPNLDLLEDLQLLARQCPGLAPREILRMGTVEGAIALGESQVARWVALQYRNKIDSDPEAAVVSCKPAMRFPVHL